VTRTLRLAPGKTRHAIRERVQRSGVPSLPLAENSCTFLRKIHPPVSPGDQTGICRSTERPVSPLAVSVIA